MDFICKICDFSKYKNIKVLSDAGTWIVNRISNLKLYPENEIMHCLCEFHVKQKINRITKDKNQVRLLIDYINNNNKKEFVSLIQDIMKGKDEKRKIQKLIKLQEYKSNGINILGLYLKSYKNHEKITLKKEELNFDIFNSSSSNVPMLYSEDNFTRLALRGLAC